MPIVTVSLAGGTIVNTMSEPDTKLGFSSVLLVAAVCIGAKPNLYCEAIELVCGGSPKICVLVERKSRLRVK